MGGGFTMKTVYSLVVNAATQNLTTAIIADYAGQRWMEVLTMPEEYISREAALTALQDSDLYERAAV